jgi:hypothetical protein
MLMVPNRRENARGVQVEKATCTAQERAPEERTQLEVGEKLHADLAFHSVTRVNVRLVYLQHLMRAVGWRG